MERRTKKEFQNSLGITDNELEKYIPQILQGLWELGSMPDYIIELIDRNINARFFNVTDFGCGKGAVLIKLAERFDFKGLGIDIVPEFIASARKYADQYSVTGKVQFKVEDLVQTIKTTTDQDVVIYGYDSEILGDLETTLRLLSGCIKDDGYIVLEFMFSDNSDGREGLLTEHEMINTTESHCIIIDRLNWSKDKIREVNQRNNTLIKQNIKTIINQHPDKITLFENYLQNQFDECKALENDFTCTTLLLQKKNCCA